VPEQEFIFIPQKLADRLKDYIRETDSTHQRIFPIGYELQGNGGKGSVVGIHLRPHDLRLMPPPMHLGPVPIELSAK